MPEAISDPKALLMRLPHVRKAVRWESSSRLYHFAMRNYTPNFCDKYVFRIWVNLTTYQGTREECSLHKTQEKSRNKRAMETKVMSMNNFFEEFQRKHFVVKP